MNYSARCRVCRGLIVLVLVIGVGLGWLVRSARINRQAVSAIKRAGGTAGYESQLYHGHFPRVTRAEQWRNWAANLIGIEYFDDVTYVRLGGGSGPEMAHVGQFNYRWRLVSLDNTQVSDTGLAHLQGISHLKWLSVNRTRVTNAGVQHLQKVLPEANIFHR